MVDRSCLKSTADGCELLVQVVPNASRTACAGLHEGALRLRLQAQPIEGRANAALVAWLADALGMPRRGVRLVAGDTTRRKRIAIDAPVESVEAWVRDQLAAAGGAR